VAVTVELRGEGDAQLRAIVREGFPLLVRALADHDRVLPRHVEREFSAYLGCGDPSAGFAWLECEDCAHHRLVLFSCKTRGFCPSCAGRRMAERAAHLVDRVIPQVATRQWVLTVPWRRRWLLARRSDLADGVLRVSLRAIGRWYRQATGRKGGKTGSVTAIQRFGSALNLNLHFHIIHLDGVFDRGADGALRFFEATPTTDDIEALVVEVGLACERWLGKQGFAGEVEDTVEDEGDALGILQLASVSGTVATGERAGRRVKRVTMLGGKEFALGPRCAGYEGYNLHANVSLAATDRVELERLCRYILRPPLAVKRLERLPDGRVRVGMKRVWSDGTGAVEFTVLEFTEKLAAIVPPARANQVLYGGVLAGNATWRKEVIPKVPTSESAKAEARLALKLVKRRKKGARAEKDSPGWAELLKRVFGVDGWQCPCCGKRMTLRTIVIGAPASTRIVSGLLRARAPPEGGGGGADRGA
jgi:hypothetical protein